MSSEPYVIEAKDFNPEKHERVTLNMVDIEWSWASGDDLFDQDLPNMPIIVRDKPTPPKLEDVIRLHSYVISMNLDCQCGESFVMTSDWRDHLANAIREAGLSNEGKQ